jgi:hypothetical protein
MRIYDQLTDRPLGSVLIMLTPAELEWAAGAIASLRTRGAGGSFQVEDEVISDGRVAHDIVLCSYVEGQPVPTYAPRMNKLIMEDL